MEILNEIKQLIARLEGRGVNDMNEEIITALEDILTDLRGFSLVTTILNLIDKVEALKAKITPVVENAAIETEQVAQDAEVVAAEVQNAGVDPVVPPVEPTVEPPVPAPVAEGVQTEL